MSIPFTQFLMPDGRPRSVSIDRPEPVEHAAKEIIKAGYSFEIEMLSTGKISMEIVNRHEEVLGSEICDNGPEVPIAIDKMITSAFELLSQKAAT